MRYSTTKVPVLLGSQSLEELVLAATRVRNVHGCVVHLAPEDVLQPWVVEQLRTLPAIDHGERVVVPPEVLEAGAAASRRRRKDLV